MALENNAVCAICGKPYRVCHTCQNIKSFLPWRTITDTLPHYIIYLAIYNYNLTKDKVKAKAELSECDLTELNNFDKDVKKIIEEIKIDVDLYKKHLVSNRALYNDIKNS